MNQIENGTTSNKLPFIPLRDTVVFPSSIAPLNLGRDFSIRAAEVAVSSQDKFVIVSCQKKPTSERPQFEDVYSIGTLTKVLKSLPTPDGSMKILVEGIQRVKILSYKYIALGYIEVEYEILKDKELTEQENLEVEALFREAKEEFEEYIKSNRKLPPELLLSVKSISEPAKFVDTVATYLNIKLQDKQQLLELTDLRHRLENLIKHIIAEKEILKIEERLHERVKQQIEKAQKEYYLTEQMKAIQKELRQKDDFAKEIEELREKIKQAKMPKEVEETALKELSRLEKMMPYSPEATVVRTYLDWLISLPWSVKTKDVIDIHKAKQILDEDHHGLEKVKERVLEYLSVLKRVKKIKGPILCFVGPPGVGKTSIAKSIARALGRNFVSVSLGGVRDEAEIRGHRRTYIGSLPGRIIQSMRKAKSKNPVFLLDEIDKIGIDWRGDPSAALLEVLDPEQNYRFVDHYLDVEFDLSDVMFICTANTTYTISPTLLDRLEVIHFSGYTWEEKLQIAKKYLVPKELKNHGAKDNEIKFTDEAIKEIIDKYTREAGVRNLQREIANIVRKVLKEITLSEEQGKSSKRSISITIDKEDVHKYLGPAKFIKDVISPNNVGVATGLAWTEYGGETLMIEATMYKGTGKLLLTGKLGEVMQESAQAAMSYVRSIADELKINSDIFKKYDFHIHIPEGAIPKDGPSAGTAITTAIASVVTGRKVKPGVAMTGEITLQGRVLPIGGLKEKLIAAYREGIKIVYYPHANQKDLDEVPQYVKEKIKLIPVKHMDEILPAVLDLNESLKKSKEKKK
ncbi:MAG: endopeptidase La [Elusimicrobiota bacterium]|nr:endopeptidase La [Endomicrobiia bacterium]MDW8056167.1 endopeptidase La [Elusimicrobiota bacterium]